MLPQEKGELLRAVKAMIDRPSEVNEEVLGDALRGFKGLIESSTGGMVEVLYVVKDVDRKECSNEPNY